MIASRRLQGSAWAGMRRHIVIDSYYVSTNNHICIYGVHRVTGKPYYHWLSDIEALKFDKKKYIAIAWEVHK